MSEKKITEAIDKIAPNQDAEKRMYENILKKAEKSYSGGKAVRIIKPIASAAACVCVVAFVAFFLRMKIADTDNLSSGVGMAFDNGINEGSLVLTTALSEFVLNETEIILENGGSMFIADVEEEAAEENNEDGFFAIDKSDNSDDTSEELKSKNVTAGAVAPEMSLEIIFNIPEGAKDIFYDEESTVPKGEFVFDDHCYAFFVSEYTGDLKSGLTNRSGLTEQEKILNYHDTNAVLYSFENESAVAYEICWENGGYIYSLSNDDGADKSDLIDIFVKSVDIN